MGSEAGDGMKKLLSAFAADETGATAIEYGAMVGFIAIGLILVCESIGITVESMFLRIKGVFGSAISASGTPS